MRFFDIFKFYQCVTLIFSRVYQMHFPDLSRALGYIRCTFRVYQMHSGISDALFGYIACKPGYIACAFRVYRVQKTVKNTALVGISENHYSFIRFILKRYGSNLHPIYPKRLPLSTVSGNVS